MMRPHWTGFSREKANALDVGRGIAIISVIYGHALAPWFMGAGESFSEAAFLQWKFGASFMMAFFFFLSGVGWREDKALSTTMRQALSLVLIALLASALYDVARLVATVTGLMPRLGADPMDPATFAGGVGRMTLFGDFFSLSALWFLVALGLVHALAALAVRLPKAVAAVLAALLVATTLASTELGWRNYWQINLLGVAFVFFIAGHATRSVFHAIERRPSAAYALLLIGGAVLAATFDLNQGCRWDASAVCGAPWLNDRFGVTMIHGQFGNLPLFAATSVAGVAFASALAILLARFGGVVGRRLDAWGGNSLNLLVLNSLFLHVGNQLISRFVAPHVAADHAVFFIALLVVTVTANLIALRVLERPLRWLHRIALTTARRLVGAVAVAPTVLAWAVRGDRVSHRNE